MTISEAPKTVTRWYIANPYCAIRSMGPNVNLPRGYDFCSNRPDQRKEWTTEAGVRKAYAKVLPEDKTGETGFEMRQVTYHVVEDVQYYAV